MALDIANSLPVPGFKFDNCLRNSYLTSKGFPAPKTVKTGTTIAGLVYRDGVVLGADTRATVGNIVADKKITKIHYLAPNMYCCGAGTAADTEQVTKMIASQLELHRLATDRVVPVKVAENLLTQHLFRYQGHVSAALIVGGFDTTGPRVYSVSPYGCSEKLPFTTMGSGSLAAVSVFEKGWKPDLPLDEAKQLVRDAIIAGIFNDLGSGSSVTLCIINKDGAELIEQYEEANVKGEILGKYRYAPGTTAIFPSHTTVKLLEMHEPVKKTNEDKENGDVAMEVA